MPKPFTVVVCGTGSIGMRHIRVFDNLLGMRTIAVPKRVDRVHALRQDGYESVQLLSDAIRDESSMLVVASNTACHLEDTLKGLSLGCRSILIEKPVLPTLNQGARLLESTSKVQAKVFVACNLRFDAALNVFRETLPEIGEIHHVRIEAQSYLPEWRPQRDYHESYSADPEQGGVLRDLIHEIDYAVWLFGKPATVTAFLSNSGRLGIDAEESADLLWRTPAGATVSIRLDYVTRHYRRLMMTFGSKGSLTWDFPSNTVSLHNVGHTPVATTIPQTRDEMMRAQAIAFAGTATDENVGPLATLQEGIFAVALCDAARTSSLTGRAESIHE